MTHKCIVRKIWREKGTILHFNVMPYHKHQRIKLRPEDESRLIAIGELVEVDDEGYVIPETCDNEEKWSLLSPEQVVKNISLADIADDKISNGYIRCFRGDTMLIDVENGFKAFRRDNEDRSGLFYAKFVNKVITFVHSIFAR